MYSRVYLNLQGPEAKFQHPLDVKSLVNVSDGNEYLLVADTYNNCLRKIDVKKKKVEKLDIQMGLNEPNSTCIDTSNRLVYIADTNNHSIKVMKNVELSSNEPIAIDEFKIELGNVDESQLEKLNIRGDSTRDVLARFSFKLNPGAENSWKATIVTASTTNKKKSNSKSFQGAFTQTDLIESSETYVYKFQGLDIDRASDEIITSMQLKLNLVYCDSGDEKSKSCKMFKSTKNFDQKELAKILSNHRIILPLD